MRQRGAVTTALALVVTLAFSGAAGAKDKPMSAKQFRKTASNICDQANQLRSQVADQYFGGNDTQPDLQTITAYVNDVKPIVQQQIDGIAALRPPKSLKKKVKKLLASARHELAALVDDPSIALESDPFAGTNELAKKLDLPACAGEATRAGGE